MDSRRFDEALRQDLQDVDGQVSVAAYAKAVGCWSAPSAAVLILWVIAGVLAPEASLQLQVDLLSWTMEASPARILAIDLVLPAAALASQSYIHAWARRRVGRWFSFALAGVALPCFFPILLTALTALEVGGDAAGRLGIDMVLSIAAGLAAGLLFPRATPAPR